MTVHQVNKSDWPRLTWKFPRIHNFDFGFGLSMENAVKCNTIVPYMYQNNAIVDYEEIKTNPQNADFGVVAYGDVCAGSYIPNISVVWTAYIPFADTQVMMMRFDTMEIGISMLNRLIAFDKKNPTDTIETILELQHATDDEITFPLFDTNKLFEEVGATYDYTPLGGFADIGLTTDGQPENVVFNKELFFDAMHYYTNKEMLKAVTDRMRTHIVSEPGIPHGRAIINGGKNIRVPSMCKFAQPYDFCGELFSVPQVASRTQFHLAAETGATEHLRVKGHVRFYEFNPDFNFARA